MNLGELNIIFQNWNDYFLMYLQKKGEYLNTKLWHYTCHGPQTEDTELENCMTPFMFFAWTLSLLYKHC